MNKLYLNQQTINAARLTAKKIADSVQTFIDQHTTISVERALCRMLGIDGVNALDIPYPNIIVDHIKDNADLSKGVAHYLSYALAEHKHAPQKIAEMIDQNCLDLSQYDKLEQSPHIALLTQYLTPQLNRIKRQKATRETMQLKPSKTPLKYVIVATGNIYEDVKQAVAAAKQGADIIAVIRTTGQSLLDYVPYGNTVEGFGGTYATQANFATMRVALDQVSDDQNRPIYLVNYASGLCMSEIAVMGALERLDMMLNDALYGIIFRDINMQRTFIDQYFSRVISAYSGITINTGEDNYLTTSDAFLEAHTVLASQFINEQFALNAHMKKSLMGLGHAYEIDPAMPNSFLYEIAQAQMAREIFPEAPLKYMPPTKHMTGDIFQGVIQNALFNITAVSTDQTIHLLGMLTEAIHTPFMSDRAQALKNAQYIASAFQDFSKEIKFDENGMIVARAQSVLSEANQLLSSIKNMGLFTALENGVFASTKRQMTSGKGLEGVFKKHAVYRNPVLELMKKAMAGDV